jgi:plastocyanin
MRTTHARLAAALASAGIILGSWLPTAHAQVALVAGDLIKLASDGDPLTTADAAVYYFGADGKRYVFPNQNTYDTWYSGFSNVKIVGLDQLGGIPIGGNVTYRPGVKMVKVTTDPKVYVVSKNGILRAIKSEAVAAALYGTNWNQQVHDLPDAFFVNYKLGADVNVAGDFNKAGITSGVPNINVDKVLVNPPNGYIDVKSGTGFSPKNMTVTKGTAVTWIALDSSAPTVASNPHPTHNDIPGFETTTIYMGQSWSYTFTTAGTWGYHNHNFPEQAGTVTVTP